MRAANAWQRRVTSPALRHRHAPAALGDEPARGGAPGVRRWLVEPGIAVALPASSHNFRGPAVTTALDKTLKRSIDVNGATYTVIIDPEGLRVVGKGKRTPLVQLAWKDLVSGEAALAVALNASVGDTRA